MSNKYLYVKNSLDRRGKWIDDLKDKPCIRCGKKYPPYVMDYHHRNPKEKSFSIGRFWRRKSKKLLLNEISKCDLLCANCHRIVEYATGGKAW